MDGIEVHFVEIGGVRRELPLVLAKPGVKIAVLNILGDTELIEASADALLPLLDNVLFDVILTAEAKSIPLVHALAVRLKERYVVLRKEYKGYMGKALSVSTVSITSGKKQTLFLDEKDQRFLKGKKVLVVDDVISTGSTLDAMHDIVLKSDASVAADVAILTEGDQERWGSVIALGHLPTWNETGDKL